MMKLYNTFGRKLDSLDSPTKDKVSLYTCGPTVYDKPTIGNWASFIRYDILARAARINGYQLQWIMNITDVGHLTSDADDGEDKLEKGARRESKTAWQIADHYTEYFMQGLNLFNISIDRSNIIRATDCIDKQIELLKRLEDKGHTYRTSDGIYFDSTTFKDYGRMAKLDLAGLQQGFRVETGGKKHATDFALWKFSPPTSEGKKRDMEWDSPWGVGFPGWHLECSAIIWKYLGESIDIHAGGIEHIPIHHTNEIAQSESATGKPLAKIWIHNNHLQVNSEKISKSLGNGYTLEDLEKNNFSPIDFRFFVLQSSYRKESNFTWELLKEAKTARLQLQSMADMRFQDIHAPSTTQPMSLEEIRSRILDAVNDNLNTPLIIYSILPKFIDRQSEGLTYDKDEFTDFIDWLDEVLGLELTKSQDIDDKQKQLIKERQTSRDDKDWQLSDKLRDQLGEQGLRIKDTPNGPIWLRIS